MSTHMMANHTQLDWRPLLPNITLPCLVMVRNTHTHEHTHTHI